MSDHRHQAHTLIDRLPESQLSALVGLLEAIVDPVTSALRNAQVEFGLRLVLKDQCSEESINDLATLDRNIARRIKTAVERFNATGTGNILRL